MAELCLKVSREQILRRTSALSFSGPETRGTSSMISPRSPKAIRSSDSYLLITQTWLGKESTLKGRCS